MALAKSRERRLCPGIFAAATVKLRRTRGGSFGYDVGHAQPSKLHFLLQPGSICWTRETASRSLHELKAGSGGGAEARASLGNKTGAKRARGNRTVTKTRAHRQPNFGEQRRLIERTFRAYRVLSVFSARLGEPLPVSSRDSME